MSITIELFYRVNIDLIGPLVPSEDGHSCILTLLDIATWLPEAVPLREIESSTIAEALIGIFSRVGIPRKILSDRRTQFTSQPLGDVHNLLRVKPLFTTSYHPNCMGSVERMHSVLKSCLRKLSSDCFEKWHRYLIPRSLLCVNFPVTVHVFSAFDGRQVRNPLFVLRELWDNNSMCPSKISSF